MIANFISLAFGRVSLRGVARVRHAALTAATGLKQYAAGHSSSTGERGGESAWDSTSDRPQAGHGGFTSPACAGVVRSRAALAAAAVALAAAAACLMLCGVVEDVPCACGDMHVVALARPSAVRAACSGARLRCAWPPSALL